MKKPSPTKSIRQTMVLQKARYIESDFTEISLRQALGCFNSRTQPQNEAVQKLQGYRTLPIADRRLVSAFAMAAHNLIGVYGQLCFVTLSHPPIGQSAAETCSKLRQSEFPLFTIEPVSKRIRLPIDAWQHDGIIWEHNLLLQYEWDGQSSKQLPKKLQFKAKDWATQSSSGCKMVAFCNVSVDANELRKYIFGNDKYRMNDEAESLWSILCQHEESTHSYFLANQSSFQANRNVERNIVEQSKALDKIQTVTTKKHRGGLPAGYDWQAIFNWIIEQPLEKPYGKIGQLHGFAIDNYEWPDKQPKVDHFRKQLSKIPNALQWLETNVITMRPRKH
jgi:hypothetical protein